MHNKEDEERRALESEQEELDSDTLQPINPDPAPSPSVTSSTVRNSVLREELKVETTLKKNIDTEEQEIKEEAQSNNVPFLLARIKTLRRDSNFHLFQRMREMDRNIKLNAQLHDFEDAKQQLAASKDREAKVKQNDFMRHENYEERIKSCELKMKIESLEKDVEDLMRAE
ncbi:hypothetical protein N7486_004148 [Penicillium sp. IBT 16267x]|nr:hypothetical protein N7486_004148 [Penicillium sp. IBT 16267x]